eukprot:1150022-Pelagomonas_calceolata.AAC.1
MDIGSADRLAQHDLHIRVGVYLGGGLGLCLTRSISWIHNSHEPVDWRGLGPLRVGGDWVCFAGLQILACAGG